MTNTYRIQSTTLFNVPGLLRWAINGYKFKRDRKSLLAVFVEGFGSPNGMTLPPSIWDRLLREEITFQVEDSQYGGDIVFKA